MICVNLKRKGKCCRIALPDYGVYATNGVRSVYIVCVAHAVFRVYFLANTLITNDPAWAIIFRWSGDRPIARIASEDSNEQGIANTPIANSQRAPQKGDLNCSRQQ